MIKKRIATVVVVLMIVAGLSLLLYPTISDYVNSLGYRRTIADYNRTVQELDTVTYDNILREAREYNERLASRTMSPLSLSEAERAVYEQMLDITGTGIMGYIEIPKVNISLPVYHGTGEAVLQSGVGHLEGSSLPIGGVNTHSILSGHTGLPSSKLFTNIDRLVEGDTFTIRVLNETLTYEVDQIRVIEPYVLNELNIEDGMDYCTLVTCTPYGVNTHRLLVRGHRIETPEKEPQQQLQTFFTDFLSLDNRFDPIMLIPVGIAIAALAVILLLAFHYRKRNPKKKNEDNSSPGTEEKREEKKDILSNIEETTEIEDNTPSDDGE